MLTPQFLLLQSCTPLIAHVEPGWHCTCYFSLFTLQRLTAQDGSPHLTRGRQSKVLPQPACCGVHPTRNKSLFSASGAVAAAFRRASSVQCSECSIAACRSSAASVGGISSSLSCLLMLKECPVETLADLVLECRSAIRSLICAPKWD